MNKVISLILFINIYLLANIGLNQKYLQSYQPVPNESNISFNPIFKYKFTKAIDKSSINTYTVTLKQISPMVKVIKGDISIKDNNTLIFKTVQLLDKGEYKIRVKPIDLLVNNSIEIKPKGWFKRFLAWLCSIFYDNVNKCPLCKKCVVKNVVKSEIIEYNFKIDSSIPKVINLKVTPNKIEISENNNTKIEVVAIFDNNKTQDITNLAQYKINTNSITIKDGILKTTNEDSATITISYGGKVTTLNVEVYEMVDNHLLPHKPKNPDATLLGIDSNGNGVRDDVERWIYKDMPTYYHPKIERVIAMTQARALQMTLIDPTNKDDKVDKNLQRSIDCFWYYIRKKNLPIGAYIDKFNNLLDDKVFNTKERLKVYMQYNQETPAKVYTATPSELVDSSYCDEDIDKLP